MLGALAKARIRLWRYDGRTLRLAAGDDPGWQPPVPHEGGRIPVMEHGWIWLQSIPDSIGFWLEVDPEDDRPVETLAPKLAEVVGSLLAGQSDLARVTEELAGRYEEIDLLYTISEILGRTVRLKEAANTILREVSTVVGARRASIMVYDEGTGMLRIVAARGVRPEQLSPVRKDDAESVAARVFRQERLLAVNAEDPVPDKAFRAEERSYLGRAYMSVPISYAAPGSAPRCVGVMNFTDRLGGDAFSTSDRKLVSAVANQVGAAVENARLAIRDLKRQRIQQELELAHDLQLKLMPAPSVLGDYADLAVRCIPADQVGGDFYTFQRRGEGKVGVMLGDVSSHGFSAALVMALVLAAAGIHTGSAGTPQEILEALHQSLSAKLSSTEMYLTVFYGVLDPEAGNITFANAGHQYAFKIPASGKAVRLETTAPPLGLAEPGGIGRAIMPWNSQEDLLCLWTDGLVDARNKNGEPFGEQRLIDALESHRSLPPEDIVQSVFDDLEAFGARPRDDRTLLVLHL